MAINPLNNTLRMTGMYSGLDTDSLVKDMMKIEQMKLDRQLRTMTSMEWKQEAYTSAGTDMKTFMNDFISMLGKNSMMKSDNYITYTATASGDNAHAVSVKATAEYRGGSIKISEIKQLAEASKAESAAGISRGGELAERNATALRDLDFAQDLNFDANGQIRFAINGTEFAFNGTDTLQSMMNTINSSEAGVTMSYSRLTDKISIESKETGSGGSVSIRNISGNAFGGAGAFGIDEGMHKNGKDAMLTINGVDVVKSQNTFTIDGMQYTLNDVTDPEDGPINVRVEKDVTGAVDKIKEFVEGYNTLVRKLNDMVYTNKSRKERGYTPLTDEEKEGMTEKQIEKWEGIAKKGLLYNDSGLKGMLSELRGALYESIEGVGLSPADIGLGTASLISSDGRYVGDTDNKYGEISLDEDALRSALERDPEQVMSVFTKISNATDPAVAAKENGLLYRVNNIMNGYIKGAGKTTLETLERSMFDAADKITETEARMLEKEERYYLKYAALEQAMASIGSQSDWLTTMLGSLNK